MIETEDVLVFGGGGLAIAGGLLAILAGWIAAAFIVCVAGLGCVLACFYID